MRETEFLNQLIKVGASLLEAQTEGEVIEQVIRQASDFGFLHVRLSLISENGTHQLVTAAGEIEDGGSQTGAEGHHLHSQTFLPVPLSRQLLYNGEGVEPPPSAQEIFDVPLTHNGRTIGHLVVESLGTDTADEYKLSLLALLADQ